MLIHSGASHRRVTLGDYVHAVRAHVRGMGQDSPIDLGYTVPTGIDTLPTITPPADVLGQLPGGGTITPMPLPAAGGGFDLTGFLNSLTKGAVAGTNIYKSVQVPALIPGTGVVYNQATGQFYNPSTGQVVNPAGATFATSLGVTSTPLIIGGAILLGVVLIASMGKR